MKVIDLFAGAGGMSLGFEMAGFETKLAIEMDAWAAETYKFNHPSTEVINGDITKIKINTFEKFTNKIDGVVGGPPCQGFSLAGNRDPKDPRNSLFMNFIKVVKKVKPKFFVMENVAGILSMKTNEGVFVKDIILKEFDKVGYEVEIKKLNAADYGVPQKRMRVFFIGVMKEMKIEPKTLFPKPMFSEKDYISIKQAIDDLKVTGKYDDPKTSYQIWARSKMDSKTIPNNHVPMKHTQRIVERFKIIQQGQSLKDVPIEHMMRQRGDANKISGKIFSQNNMRPFYNKPSPTIAASYQGNFVHPKLNRNFTAREGARLQSFPDHYIFQGKRTTMSWEKNLSQYQQIGNAVPPLLAKAIAEQIKKTIITQNNQ